MCVYIYTLDFMELNPLKVSFPIPDQSALILEAAKY